MTSSAPPQSACVTLDDTLKAQVGVLACTLRHRTIRNYQTTVQQFLDYLHAAFPGVRRLSQLHRAPHMLGWFRWLCERNPPLTSGTRLNHLVRIRRLFCDLADNGQYPRLSGMVLSKDFPRRPQYLPRPLSPENDQLLQQELRRTDDLYSNALLLMRATGIRIGECAQLAGDCLRQLDSNQWALLVPPGKMYTERLVPIDEYVCHLIARIRALRELLPVRGRKLDSSGSWLLPHFRGCQGGWSAAVFPLRKALRNAVKRAGCCRQVAPHQLRHTYATEMLRLGVSLPALMRLLGHNDIKMTLRYVEVTQHDLQREFHHARQSKTQNHSVPKLPLSTGSSTPNSDLSGIRQSLAATRHLLEMYRRQLPNDEMARRKLQRLDKRLITVDLELQRLTLTQE